MVRGLLRGRLLARWRVLRRRGAPRTRAKYLGSQLRLPKLDGELDIVSASREQGMCDGGRRRCICGHEAARLRLLEQRGRTLRTRLCYSRPRPMPVRRSRPSCPREPTLREVAPPAAVPPSSCTRHAARSKGQ